MEQGGRGNGALAVGCGDVEDGVLWVVVRKEGVWGGGGVGGEGF